MVSVPIQDPRQSVLQGTTTISHGRPDGVLMKRTTLP